jgi:hypothetical protein
MEMSTRFLARTDIAYYWKSPRSDGEQVFNLQVGTGQALLLSSSCERAVRFARRLRAAGYRTRRGVHEHGTACLLFVVINR